jgi:hypothetical protein
LKCRKALKFRRRVTTKVGFSIVDCRTLALNSSSYGIVGVAVASTRCPVQRNRVSKIASLSREVGGTGYVSTSFRSVITGEVDLKTTQLKLSNNKRNTE